jgi:dolichol-phosphate mannosyltransferase
MPQASDVGKPLLTVICPVYNEEKTIKLFYDRLSVVFDRIADRCRSNVVFVDNCSTDRTLQYACELRALDPRVYHIGLSINVGYQKSIEFGFRQSRGDLFAIVDVDCEDPPEMLAEFLEVQQLGFDIVYGERVDREEGPVLKLMRKFFYRLTRFVSDEHFFVDMAEFCLFTREVRDAIALDQSSFPFIRASIGRVGFNYRGIPYKRHKRIAGETHYNLYRMTTFAVAGILSSSTLPLRFLAYIFPPVILGIAAKEFFGIGSVRSELILLSYISLGITFLSIYLARVYKNGLGRPNAFLVNRRTILQPKDEGNVE